MPHLSLTLSPATLPTLGTVLAMSSFALVGAITPGPVNILALRHGSQARPLVAWLYVLGASLSYAAVVWCMGQGAQQLLVRWPGLRLAATWLGAGYLLWLAWRLLQAPATTLSAGAPQSSLQPWRAFAQGSAVQSLNPKAWLVALSGVSLFVIPHGPQAWGALYGFCLVSLTACLLGVGSWALLGKVLAQWLHTPPRQKMFHRLLAALLALSVLSLLA